jgi:hypothetical protein
MSRLESGWSDMTHYGQITSQAGSKIAADFGDSRASFKNGRADHPVKGLSN